MLAAGAGEEPPNSNIIAHNPPSSAFKCCILYGLRFYQSRTVKSQIWEKAFALIGPILRWLDPYCVGCTRTLVGPVLALVQRWRQENLSRDKIPCREHCSPPPPACQVPIQPLSRTMYMYINVHVHIVVWEYEWYYPSKIEL